MKVNVGWRRLGWRHPVWDLLRFYSVVRSQRKKGAAEEWREKLARSNSLEVDDSHRLPLKREVVELFLNYLDRQASDLTTAESALCDEKSAVAFAKSMKAKVGTVTTRSPDHHQSSSALVAAVSCIALKVCREKNISCDTNPQRRCMWLVGNHLHVTARNLDGAAPALLMPKMVWETKEYWGKTKGGSKMSDAVYECHLVGRELREFEDRSGASVTHVVFVDGKTQWGHRRSDLRRLIDLFHQGIIDELLVGKEVETDWEALLHARL